MRLWSARNARWLRAVYRAWENFLSLLHPLFTRIGYERLDRYFLAVEKLIKGFLFDSRSCGQCTLQFTGMSCPMNCPKRLRNGPCGGVPDERQLRSETGYALRVGGRVGRQAATEPRRTGCPIRTAAGR